MKKIMATVIVLLMLSATLSGCVQHVSDTPDISVQPVEQTATPMPEPTPTPIPTPTLDLMPTPGTLKTSSEVNSERFAGGIKQDDWVYYVDGTDLYKILIDGTRKQFIADNVKSGEFEVIGDWIYYSTGDYPFSLDIYRINTDGTKKTRLIGNSENFQIKHLFQFDSYSGNANYGGIGIIMDRNLGENEYFMIVDGWILFYADNPSYFYGDENSGIYKMRLDGSELTKTDMYQSSEEVSWSLRGIFDVIGSSIYYIYSREIYSNHRTDSIRIFDVNGTQSAEILELDEGEYVDWRQYKTIDNEIYVFKNHNEIYKYSKDKEKQRICFHSNGDLYCIDNILGGWVYYSTYDSAGLYRVKTDGTENTLLFEGSIYYPVFEGNYMYGLAYDKKDKSEKKGYLLKLSLDGSEKIKLANVKSTDRWTTVDVFAITDDWVYYSLDNSWYIDDPDGEIPDMADYSFDIYRVSKSGGKAKKFNLLEDYYGSNGGRFTLLDGWIYFAGGDGGLYKIRDNGKNKQLVESAK